MKQLILRLLAIYQKFLTAVFGYGSCRYYPTCSEYAKWQIESNNFFKALFFSALRVLRCNQFFQGGIDYPLIKKDFSFPRLSRYDNKAIKIKYWYIPKDNDSFYVVKFFEDKELKK